MFSEAAPSDFVYRWMRLYLTVLKKLYLLASTETIKKKKMPGLTGHFSWFCKRQRTALGSRHQNRDLVTGLAQPGDTEMCISLGHFSSPAG